MHKVVGDEVRMIGADLTQTIVKPSQDKMWLAVEALLWLCQCKSPVPVAVIDSAVGVLTWCFLIQRSALSIFDEVYEWLRQHRGKGKAALPREVAREL